MATVSPFQTRNTQSPFVTRKTLPAHLGGGSYTVGPDRNKVYKEPRTNKPDNDKTTQQDHIFPVSLGGTSRMDNIRRVKNNPVNVETKNWRDYETGKIPLGRARMNVITHKQDQEKIYGVDEKSRTTKGNFFQALKETVKKAVTPFGGKKKQKDRLVFKVGDVKPEFKKEAEESFDRQKQLAKQDYFSLEAGPGQFQQKGEQVLTGFGASENVAAKFGGTLGFALTALEADPRVSKLPTRQLTKFSRNVDDISRTAVNSLQNAPKPKPGSYVRALDEVKAGVKPPVKVRTLEDGSLFIEDGRHHLEAARRLGVKDYPIEDVTSHYKTRETLRTPDGRFNGSKRIEDNPEAGFIRPPNLQDTKLGQTLKPVKSLDEDTQKIFQNRNRKTLTGKQLGNIEANKVSGKQSFDDVLKHEAGLSNPIAKKAFADMRSEAIERGIPVGELPDFVPHVYKNKPEEVVDAVSRYMKDKNVPQDIIDDYVAGKDIPEVVANRLRLNPSFSKHRVFPDYKTAMEYGLRPKFQTLSEHLGYYREQLETTLANREFIDSLVKKGKLVDSFNTTPDMKAIELPFSPKGYYAKPDLANMLNGMFRDEANLNLGQTLAKGTAFVSRKAQEVVLSGGFPKSNVNFFSIGQLIKELTSGNVKAVVPFVRSNFNKPSVKFFQDNQETMVKMSHQGLDLGNHIANYDNVYKTFLKNKTWKEMAGDTFDKLFNEKTFASFMPQLHIETFKTAVKKGLKKGMSQAEAEKFAGDVVRAAFGVFENVGRSQTTDDVITATFLAPKFREGLINVFANTLKSVTTQARNPAYYKNRRLLAGMALTYASYNAMNQKLNGTNMWDNEPGHEFELKIVRDNGDVIYIPFMPSFTALPRTIASGTVNLFKGNLDVAGQKASSLFSIPIKTGLEVLNNSDYWGEHIYEEEDSREVKALKIAQHIGMSVNHPYVKELIIHVQKKRPWYQTISKMMELPAKFSSLEKIEKQKGFQKPEAKVPDNSPFKTRR